MLRSLAVRLMSGFLVVIVVISAIFTLVGIRFIDIRVIGEAQRRVASDLNAAREIYQEELRNVEQVVRLTADRLFLKDAMRSGHPDAAAAVLSGVLGRENLDLLTVTDASGRVVFRAGNPGRVGDDRSDDPLVHAALVGRRPVAATAVLPATELRGECPDLATRAYCTLVETPHARVRLDTAETAGMVLEAAAPIEDTTGALIGVLYGGVLLNRRFELVDKIKQTVFQDEEYRGKSVGTATVFLDDVRIATNVRAADGTRAVGTRAAADVYEQVVRKGRRWMGRAFVVNDWYIAAYEPIRNIRRENIDMLYLGILEAPYLDLKWRSTMVFLAITLAGAALTVALSYVISRRMSGPLGQLAGASARLARGDLSAKVDTAAPVAEIAEVAESFNTMAAALRARDVKLQEFARRKIMESERLAIIGQLAADVAHELNNPLQGIVTYSHLLQERAHEDNGTGAWVDKIVTQANRCTTIIRGLLDFARPRTPVKKPADLNAVLAECLSLVENQALFHNIEIVKELAPDLPPVVVDPSLMQQVFVNLIINAVEAMEGPGRLTLTTSYDPAAEVVEVDFADTGHGISEENLDRIFEPFFTTKAVGHGTGLGLAISYGIVREHHGAISVESQVGVGTSFSVRLPLREPAEAP